MPQSCLVPHAFRAALLSTVLLGALTGCKSDYDQQVEKAKADAITTGQSQQVIAVDKAGRTTVTIVQPSTTPGTQPTVTSTITPAGAPLVAGEPDWSNGARPAPGKSVLFVGPKTAPAQSAAPLAPGETAPAAQATAQSSLQPSSLAPSAAAQPQSAAFIPANVTLPAGTGIAIRINQTISVKHSHAGDRFTGSLAESLGSPAQPVLPRGTRVNGVVTEAHRRGHFKGRSYLGLRLTSIAYEGKTYPIATASIVRTKKGKGKRSAAFIGSGAGLGMLVGGVATGGVGLAVGGLAGGGLGTLLGGLTGNRDIEIPAESLVRFRLEDDLVVQPAE